MEHRYFISYLVEIPNW